MSSFFANLPSTSSQSTKLALIAVASVLITSTTIFSTQALVRRRRRHDLREEIEDRMREEMKQRLAEEAEAEAERADDTGDDDDERDDVFVLANEGRDGEEKLAKRESRKSLGRRKKGTSEIIIKESLARNYVFFGEEGMEKIRHSFVVVVGLGGVGSVAATMLVRSGVGKIRLIDFDQLSLSSLNRHSTATLSQVGTPKVTSCAEHFQSIAPWVEVDARIDLFGAEAADELIAEGNPDYVLDCIDNIDSKFSTEKPRPEIGLLPLPEDEFQKGKVEELSALANFRVRILPVLGPLPAMFGNAAAAYVLQQLAGFKTETLCVKNKGKLGSLLHRHLAVQELRLNGLTKIPVSEEDLLYLFEEINRGRSISPPHTVPSRPCVMRWKKALGLAWDNLVVFEREEGERHEEHCLVGDEDPEVYWGPEITDLVNKRIEEERRLRHYRL